MHGLLCMALLAAPHRPPACAGAGACIPLLQALSCPRCPASRSGPVTSVEWCPYESSMLATTSADNQLAVWDLALERDPGECGWLAGWAVAATQLMGGWVAATNKAGGRAGWVNACATFGWASPGTTRLAVVASRLVMRVPTHIPAPCCCLCRGGGGAGA